MENIKNIIFDLGGVFIDVDYLQTKNAFGLLGIDDFDKYFMQHHSNPLFADFETGRITDEAFFDGFRKETRAELINEDIAVAWNAMLGDFRKSSFDWLAAARKNYRIFLYSNTNRVHHVRFSQAFREQFHKTLEDVFDRVYYSHDLQHRKPDAGGFIHILHEQGLDPAETLFIDDTVVNVEAAGKLGIQTILLKAPQRVEDLGL